MVNKRISKSFSFNIAKSPPKADKPFKSRDGVAMTGCKKGAGPRSNFRASLEA